MNLEAILRDLVSIPSVTKDGNDEYVNFVASLLQSIGMKTTLQPVPHSNEELSKRQFNVIGILGDPLVDRKIRKGILLTTHLDTVPYGIPAHWDRNEGNPRKLSIHDGVAFGTGVADGKFALACMVAAIAEFREVKLKQPVCFLGTCCEKAGNLGAKYLLQSNSLNPKAVVVGAPTGLQVGVTHPGHSVLRISVGFQTLEKDARGFNRKVTLQSFGRIGSSALPSDGVHSFLQLLDFVRNALESGFEIQITKIGGGLLADQIPDFSEAEMFLTAHQFEDFKRFFREALSQNPKPNTFRLEMGGAGDLGIRFLPQALFSLFYELLELQDSGVQLNRVVQLQNRMDLYFHLSGTETEALIRNAVQKLSGNHPHLVIQVTNEYTYPSLVEKEDDRNWTKDCLDAAKSLSLSANPFHAILSNEAGQYQSKGYPVVFFGPGKEKGNIHTSHESVVLSEGAKTVAFYQDRIRKICR